MASNAIDKEITALEREYWDSMMTKDPRVATRLTAAESVIVGAQGVSTVTPKTIGPMVESDGWKLKKYEFSDIKVSSPAPDFAVIAYKVKEDLEVEGKPVSFVANDSTAWMRENGRWVSILHTESIAGDPFGRDRNQTK